MPGGSLYKGEDLPKTIKHTGNSKPEAILVTYFDGHSGQMMAYLPTEDPKTYKRGTKFEIPIPKIGTSYAT